MVDIFASSSGYLYVTTTGILKLLRSLPRRVERRSDQHDDFMTKCKFDNVYGRRNLLNDGIVSVTDVIMCRKRPCARFALSLSLVLVLVCALPNVTPSAHCRRAWWVSRWHPVSDIDSFVSIMRAAGSARWCPILRRWGARVPLSISASVHCRRKSRLRFSSNG